MAKSKTPHPPTNPFDNEEEWKTWFETDPYYISSNKTSKNTIYTTFMTEKNQQTQESTSVSLFKKYRIAIIGVLSFALILVIGTSTLILQRDNSSTKTAKNEETRTEQKENNDNDKLAQSKEIKVIDITKLSDDKDKSDTERARNRIALLTNNTNPDEINSLIEPKKETVDNQLSTQPNTTSTPAIPIVNPNRAESIIKSNNITDSNLWYSEKVIQYTQYADSLYSSGGGMTNPVFSDYTKPITTKTFTTINNYRYTEEVDGKVKITSIFTPDYNLLYLGGKYAIKSEYKNPVYFNSLAEGSDITQNNSDIWFYNSIINDTNFWTNKGTVSREGKDYTLYETSTDYGSGFGTKVFLDMETFTIAFEEQYDNNNLVSTTTTKKLGGIKIDNLGEVFDNQALGGIEVKTVQSSYDYYNYSNPDLVQLSKEFSLLTSDNALPFTYYAFKNWTYGSTDPYSLVANTTDFDPNYQPVAESDMYGGMFGGEVADINYTSTEFDTYTIKIYNEEQKRASSLDYFVNDPSGYYTLKNTSPVQLTINGATQTATAYEVTSQNFDDTIATTIRYSFNHNNQFYILTIGRQKDRSQIGISPVTLTTLTSDKAQEYAQSIEKANTFYDSKFISSFNEVPEAIRMINPSYSTDFEISVTLPQKTDPTLECSSLSIYINTLAGCLRDKYNGATYIYIGKAFGNSSLSITILDINYNDFDLNKECKNQYTSICSYSETPTIADPIVAPFESGYYIANINGKVGIIYAYDSMGALVIIDGITPTFDIQKADELIPRYQ